MAAWPAESVDLVYLDPPFNSKTDYNMLFSTDRAEAQYRAFTDKWWWGAEAQQRYNEVLGAVVYPAHSLMVGLHGVLGGSGMLAYLLYMSDRLIEMHRLLKPTGSLYLHCDPTASHYLKLLLDQIFGAKNFRNEIVWCYAGGGSGGHDFPKKHDTIFRYSKGGDYIFNEDAVRIPYDSDYKSTAFPGADTRAPGKAYTRNPKGKVVQDWWDKMPRPYGKDRLGYPTQKPLKLLERIIRASSHKGDVVLDPFCGCGTTVEAAHDLKRKWVGIDVSSFAIELIKEKRFKDLDVPVEGIPYDFRSAKKLAKASPFRFETWAIMRIPGLAPNTKQRGDGGVDGMGTLWQKADNHDSKLVLAQVKAGDKFNIAALRSFIGVMETKGAVLGVYISLERVPQKGTAHAEAAALGTIRVGALEYPRLRFWSIEEYFPGKEALAMPPMIDPYTGKPMDKQRDILFDNKRAS